MTRATTRLRELLASDQPVYAPDCNSALTARVLEKVGFSAGYAGGHGLGMMHYAIPDYGVLTTTEMVDQASRISPAVGIPIIYDGDQVGESVAEVYRTIPMYERVGAAGIHIEDEQAPKHSAWQGPLVSIEDQQGRIAAAVAGRTDPDFVIIARTNELQNRKWYGENEGNLDGLIRRGQAYAEAGADLFLCNMCEEDELERIVREVPIPICDYNRPRPVAEKYGLSLILFTGFATAAAVTAHRRWAQTLLDTGDIPVEAFTLEDKDELIGESRYSEVVRGWAQATGRRVTQSD